MEFQGTITGDHGQPLGSLADVEGELCRMFPGLIFNWSLSGAEKLAMADAGGIELPAMVTSVLRGQPACRCGACEAGEVSVTFNLGAADPVACVWATVSGTDAAVASLARLRARRGWLVLPSIADAPDNLHDLLAEGERSIKQEGTLDADEAYQQRRQRRAEKRRPAP
jgi:hypothetical protein